MDDFVIKLALPGYDIADATPEQCAIHSEYPPLKSMVDQQPGHFATVNINFTSAITQGVTHTLISIPHPYGRIPLNFSSIIFNNGSGTTAVGIGFAGIGANLSVNAYADSNNFYITIFDNFNWVSSSASLQVSFYIFAEDGT